MGGFFEGGGKSPSSVEEFSVSPPGTGGDSKFNSFLVPQTPGGVGRGDFGSLFSRFRAIFGVKISPITKIFACGIFYIFDIDINEKLFS